MTYQLWLIINEASKIIFKRWIKKKIIYKKKIKKTLYRFIQGFQKGRLFEIIPSGLEKGITNKTTAY
jgi:hypothetical protein